MNPDGAIYTNETQVGNSAWSKIYENDSGTIININGIEPIQITGLPLVFKCFQGDSVLDEGSYPGLEFRSTGMVVEITRDDTDGSWTISLNDVTNFNTTVDDIITALLDALPVSGNNTITNNGGNIYINDSNINKLGEFEFLDILSGIYIPNAGPYIDSAEVDENGKVLYAYNTHLTDTAWQFMSECGYWTYDLRTFSLQIRLIYINEFSTYTPDVIITTSDCFDKFNGYITSGYDSSLKLVELDGYYRSGDSFPRNIVTFLKLSGFANLKFPNILSIRNRNNSSFYNVIQDVINATHDSTSDLNFICGGDYEVSVFPNINDFNSNITYTSDLNDTVGYMESNSETEYDPTNSEWLSMNNLSTTNINYNCLSTNMEDLYGALKYSDDTLFPSNSSSSYSNTKEIDLDLASVYYPNYATSDSICPTALYNFVWLPVLWHPNNAYGIYPVDETDTTNNNFYGTVC